MFSFKGFNKYQNKKTTMKYGTLFVRTINIPFSKEKRRTLRVWLPPQYDDKSRFPVIYMSDGQNMVDKYTSAFHSWRMDRVMNNYSLLGNIPFIIVGIDCPKEEKERENEYSFKGQYIKNKHSPINPYGENFADYLVNRIKPLIDKTFLTNSSYTGFCGSSMGGLFSFFIGYKYSDIFKFLLVFSPAFCLLKHNYLNRLINNDIHYPIIYLYNGGRGLEKELKKKCDDVYFMLSKMPNIDIFYRYDKWQRHNEKAWNKYVLESLLFITSKIKC